MVFYGIFNIRFQGAKVWNDINDDLKLLPLKHFKKNLKAIFSLKTIKNFHYFNIIILLAFRCFWHFVSSVFMCSLFWRVCACMCVSDPINVSLITRVWLPLFFSPYGYLGQPVLLSIFVICFLNYFCFTVGYKYSCCCWLSTAVLTGNLTYRS